MTAVTLEELVRVFPGGVRAVDGLSIEVADGELLVLVGPSGCGKTTTLRLIAGLETPTAGAISLGGRVVNPLPPRHRDVAMVFQRHALYPHMSVRQNLAFGLKLRRTPAPEVRRRVDEAAAMLGIGDLLDRRPGTLSGGQQQRVALGRAIVRQPAVFLLDEPLSNLDAALRVRMRAEIRRLHARLGTTMIYVTHDQVEAMTMGQRVAALDEGRIQQADDPLTLYRRPANRFVAGLIGFPPMNLLDGRLENLDGRLVFRHARLSVPVPEEWTARLASCCERPITLGVRPEHVTPVAGVERTQAAVEAVEPVGPESYLYASTGGQVVVARVDPRQAFRPGQQVDLALAPGNLHFFDAESGRAVR